MEILVIPPRKTHLKRALSRFLDSGFFWAYLGGHVREYNRVKNTIDGQGTFLDTSPLFQESAEACRKPYLEFISRMGREVNSLRWWVSPLSHGDYCSSRTFHQACYLRVALELTSTWSMERPLLLIVSGEALLEALDLNLGGRYGVQVFGLRRQTLFHYLMNCLQVVVHRGAFVLREVWCLLMTRSMIPARPIPNTSVTVLMIPADRETLGSNKMFQTAFFGDLAEQLVRRGHAVGLVPLVAREMTYVSALGKLQNERLPLLIPHRYIRLSDVLWAVWETLFLPVGDKRAFPAFQGMRIDPLIVDDLRRGWIGNWSAEALLIASLVARWKEAGIPIERVIYLYENQPWERALCWAVRRSMPDVSLVAFQHSRLPRLLLKFFLGLGEEAVQPGPHRIVTLGSYSARLFCENGQSPERVRVGGGLRYQRLLALSKNGIQGKHDPENPRVIIASSIEWPETEEILESAGQLAKLGRGIHLLLKTHPRLSYEIIHARYGYRLPAAIEVTDEVLTNLLPSCSVLVYGSSTACLEGLAFGVPMIHIRPRFITDHDPLELAQDLRLEARGGEELCEKVSWLLGSRDAYVESLQESWRKFVQDFISPVGEETYNAFLR